MLYHVSEQSDIKRFEPRLALHRAEPVVWAIDADRLRNYLVPRDCPRVTFYAGPETSASDMDRFLGASQAVVAIQGAWWERLRTCRLYCYHLPAETFECIDECAGYFVSRDPIVPSHVEVFTDPVAELVRRGVELRLVPDLLALQHAVVASTLRYSIIRMKNALRAI